MGSCRGQYVVDHVPSAERLGFLQKKKNDEKTFFYIVEEKILPYMSVISQKKKFAYKLTN